MDEVTYVNSSIHLDLRCNTTSQSKKDTTADAQIEDYIIYDLFGRRDIHPQQGNNYIINGRKRLYK